VARPVGPIPDSYWVTPGQLLAGEYPGALNRESAVAKLERIRAVGVNFFLDLTEQREGLRPYSSLLAASPEVAYKRMEIRDLSYPSRAEMIAILDTIDDALNANRVVYVHCWGGIGRTGTVVGCWLVRHGQSGTEALESIDAWREGTPDGHRASPETSAQKQMILEWHEP
jgi:Cyclin-dependent kinase inhibitor 3 (CDKN3)